MLRNRKRECSDFYAWNAIKKKRYLPDACISVQQRFFFPFSGNSPKISIWNMSYILQKAFLRHTLVKGITDTVQVFSAKSK